VDPLSTADPDPIRRQPFSGLATKIILLVFASTFVTATVVSWISIQSTHDSLRAAIDRLYPLMLDHSARSVGPWAERLRSQLARSREHRRGRLSADAALPADFIGAVSLAPDGALRGSAGSVPSQLPRPDPGDPPSLALGALDDGEPVLTVASGRPDRDGIWLGVVSLATLSSLLGAELPDSDALFLVVDRDGRVLAHSGRWPDPELPTFLDRKALPVDDQMRELDVGATHAIGVARPLPQTRAQLVLLAPFEVAYGPLLSVITRIFITDLCVILIFSFLAYRVTSRVVRPIENLSEAARRVAQGDTDLAIDESHSRDEIGLLTRTFNDMMRQLRRHRAEIEDANRHLTDRNARLQQANEVLNQLSITDGLTKLHNHRFFQDHLTREIKRVSRSEEPLSMLLIDIDDFKRLNDRLGHAAGDEILSRIARILNGSVRETDLCARYGGEEFVVLTSDTDVVGAYGLAEKIRTAIAESSFIVDDSLRPLRATVSIGVARFEGNRKRFFQKADQALYRAKANGKNCVCVDEDHEQQLES
jgi:diguanylate cyclase (GGDEF)-like protein